MKKSAKSPVYSLSEKALSPERRSERMPRPAPEILQPAYERASVIAEALRGIDLAVRPMNLDPIPQTEPAVPEIDQAREIELARRGVTNLMLSDESIANSPHTATNSQFIKAS